MQHIEGFNEYIYRCEQLMREVIKARITYIQIKQHEISTIDSLIRSKDHRYHRTNSKIIHERVRRIKSIIEKQERLTLELKKKKREVIHYALDTIDYIEASDKSKRIVKKKIHQLLVTLTWTYSQSYFLEHQKKILKTYSRKNTNSYYFYLKDKLNIILQRDFNSYLFKEEQELQLSINVFKHRHNHFFTYSKHVKQLEKISSLQKNTLKAALLCNSLPIHGVGDLLSLPFWLLYGVLWGFEHKFKEFNTWNTSKKVTLPQLYEELERIEKTI
ncbi:MAG: hypothetical protein ACLFPL_01845 [Candidatus Nanoarchaeia archaeon]